MNQTGLGNYSEPCLVRMYLKGGTKSVLIIRGTYYQGWLKYMRYTQGQNEKYLLSRIMY